MTHQPKATVISLESMGQMRARGICGVAEPSPLLCGGTTLIAPALSGFWKNCLNPMNNKPAGRRPTPCRAQRRANRCAESTQKGNLNAGSTEREESMTENRLIPTNENPIQDLVAVSDQMKAYIGTENDEILEMTVARMNRTPTLWRKIFPDAFDREQQKILLDRVRTAYKDRRAFLNAYVTTQLEIVQRRGDALVVATSMDLRAKLAVFAKLKIDELSQTLFESKDQYYRRIADHINSLEQYRDIPDLFELARQAASREIRSYLDWVEGLRDGFTDALKAKVAGKD